jgi:Tol biopolymer transport system component
VRRSPRSIALAMAVTLCTAGLARAVPAEEPADTGMLNGKVRSLVQVGSRIWAGGTFTQMQDASGINVRAVNNLAAFDAATGAPDLAMAIPAVTKSGGTPVVYDMAVAPDGVTLYLVGAFSHVGGVARKNAAAIDTTTGAVLAFNPGPAIAYSVLPTAGAIYVGTKKLQSFRPDGSETPGYIAPTAVVNASLRAHTTQPLFRDLALDGPDIVAACHCDSLTDLNGTRLTKAMVRINATTGAWVNWAPTNLTTTSAAFGISLVLGVNPVTSAPTVYLGAGGSDFVAAYTLATGQQQWKTDTSGSAQSVALHGGHILVGGHYEYIEGPLTANGCGDAGNPNPFGDCLHVPRLAAVDPVAGDIVMEGAEPWNPGICCKYNGVWAVLTHADGERVSIGGEFTKVGGTWSFVNGAWRLTGFQPQNYFGQLPPPPNPSLTVNRAGGGSGGVTSVPAGIDCGATCTASYASGTQVTLQASPDGNSTFTGWNGACSGTGDCVVTLTTSTSVTATFEATPATLGVSVGGTGAGGVTSVPAGIDCGIDCDEVFTQGSSVTLTATPGAGSAFAGWNGACEGQPATCELTMTGGLTTDALFEPAVVLDVSRAGAGAGRVTSDPSGIDCGATCVGGFAPGQMVTLTADPDVASTFEGWSDPACPGAAPCVVEMSEARSVTATFGEGTGCGRILFTSTRDGNEEIYVMRPDGSQVTRLTNLAGTDKDPSWSPDCTRIAFSSNRQNNPEIWVMNADGTAPTRLTDATGADTDPTWSPDGSQIAFVSGRTGNSEVFTMTASGANPTNRTSSASNDRAPDWSPDGSTLAFSSNRTGNFQVFSMPAAGGAATRLTTGLGVCDAPAWSPDGTRLAITSTSSGTAQIWTIAPDGSGAVRVSSGGGTESHPSWAPDGGTLAFGSNVSGGGRVWIISPDGSGAGMVSDDVGPDTTPGWS